MDKVELNHTLIECWQESKTPEGRIQFIRVKIEEPQNAK